MVCVAVSEYDGEWFEVVILEEIDKGLGLEARVDDNTVGCVLGLAEYIAVCEKIAENDGVNNHKLSFLKVVRIAESGGVVNIVWS